MRAPFAAMNLILITAGFVSCAPRTFNEDSQTKTVGDIVSMKPDGNGGFVVVCKNQPQVEHKVSADAVRNKQVCTDAPQVPTTLTKVVQINPKAFNARNLWLGEQSGIEILDYPLDFGKQNYGENSKRDGFFFETEVSKIPPPGVKVVNGDVLEYPERNGKTLKLKFRVPESWAPLQEFKNIKRLCAENGLRPPTVHELSDFCNAGRSEANAKPWKFSSPCLMSGHPNWDIWSVTSFPGNENLSFTLNSSEDWINRHDRDKSPAMVMCVGWW